MISVIVAICFVVFMGLGRAALSEKCWRLKSAGPTARITAYYQGEPK